MAEKENNFFGLVFLYFMNKIIRLSLILGIKITLLRALMRKNNGTVTAIIYMSLSC